MISIVGPDGPYVMQHGTFAIRHLLPLALLPILSGCLFTGPMWRDANQRLLEEPRTFGVIDPHPNGANNGGQRLLVVRYSINGWEELYAEILLTGEGVAVAPFAYTGPERRPEKIVDALPEDQRRQLAQTRLTLHNEKWAREIEQNPRFRRLNWQTDGTSVPYDGTFDREDPGQRNCRCCADVRIRAVRLQRPWTESESAAMPLPVGTSIEYPRNAWVLVLPYAQPRPEEHQRSAQRRAALLTPAAVLGDAVGVPLLYIACYVFGQCP